MKMPLVIVNDALFSIRPKRPIMERIHDLKGELKDLFEHLKSVEIKFQQIAQTSPKGMKSLLDESDQRIKQIRRKGKNLLELLCNLSAELEDRKLTREKINELKRLDKDIEELENSLAQLADALENLCQEADDLA